MPTPEVFDSAEIPRPRLLTGPTLPPCLAGLVPNVGVIRLWGELPTGPVVALVGSRKASPGGLAAARAVAQDLGRRGFVVASGGAEGVDEMAHRGALDAAAPTLVVAPAPLHAPYPKDLAPLFREVVERGGGYLTLNPGERVGGPGSFFARNRALMALADIVLLGESRIDSGAMNALAAARRLRRPCFVLPCELELVTTRGSQQAVEKGWARPYFRVEQLVDALGVRSFARPEYVATVARVRTEAAELRQQLDAKRRGKGTRRLGPPDSTDERGETLEQTELPFANEQEPLELPVDGDERLLVEAVLGGATTAELLVERTGLEPARVARLLVSLSLDGIVGQDDSGLLRYDRRP